MPGEVKDCARQLLCGDERPSTTGRRHGLKPTGQRVRRSTFRPAQVNAGQIDEGERKDW